MNNLTEDFKKVITSVKHQDLIEREDGVTYKVARVPFTGAARSFNEMVNCFLPQTLRTETNYKNGKLHGLNEKYHDNGQLTYKRNYKDGKLHGLWENYYDNGQLRSKGNYKKGKQDGFWEYYHKNGKLRSKGNWKNGEPDGLWEKCYENGQLRSKENYKNGKQDGLWEEYLLEPLWSKRNQGDDTEDDIPF